MFLPSDKKKEQKWGNFFIRKIKRKKTKRKLLLYKLRKRIRRLSLSRKKGMSLSTTKIKLRKSLSIRLKIADKHRQKALNLFKKVKHTLINDFRQIDKKVRGIEKNYRDKKRRRYRSTRG